MVQLGLGVSCSCFKCWKIPNQTTQLLVKVRDGLYRWTSQAQLKSGTEMRIVFSQNYMLCYAHALRNLQW